ncbi:MAG: ECF transporter S component [Lachnospiraceae bacterium]|nr:ECF transporter S component [Lachnospiraceae bacterium]MBO4462186.1 ECF transporter S component [Lachnospiraceae bacterium]MBR4795032.1 ECF transporter S component [Lachnospiraceae bacterium]MBR5788949.1 ECF transporter S component [Lachnospiraceae bacterium]
MRKQTETKKKRIDVHMITITPMLAVIAFLLMYVETSIPIMPSFLKFDISDMPAFIGSFAFGPVCGALICFIKNLLHLPLTHTGGVGELANFIIGISYVIPAGIIYKMRKTKRNAFFGAMIGCCIAGLISLPINYFVVYPFYYNFMSKDAIIAAYKAILPMVNSIFSCLLVFNLPFTIGKGIIVTIITMLIYKPLSPLIKGKNRE